MATRRPTTRANPNSAIPTSDIDPKRYNLKAPREPADRLRAIVEQAQAVYPWLSFNWAVGLGLALAGVYLESITLAVVVSTERRGRLRDGRRPRAPQEMTEALHMDAIRRLQGLAWLELFERARREAVNTGPAPKAGP